MPPTLEVLVIFFAVGGFLSWLGLSVVKLRRSNHRINNQLHAIAAMLELQTGRSPLSGVPDDRERRN